MLNIGLLSLIFALTSGGFGFAANAPPVWTWEKVAFLIFLLLAATSFVAGTLSRPSQLWEPLDEMQDNHFSQPKLGQPCGLK